MGNSTGKFIKIDACTSTIFHRRHSRLCVQMNLNNPVPTWIQIGSHMQQVVYKVKGFLCKCCGYLGHVQKNCQFKKGKLQEGNQHESKSTDISTQESSLHAPTTHGGEWQTVLFSKKKKSRARKKGKRNGNWKGFSN